MNIDLTQTQWLSILNRANAESVKEFVNSILPSLERYTPKVIENRTGLVMLPATDTAQGTHFHLGEVLVSEAKVEMKEFTGYSVCLGRDLEQVLAVAILDASLQGKFEKEKIENFIGEQSDILHQADQSLLTRAEATRVEMETF